MPGKRRTTSGCRSHAVGLVRAISLYPLTSVLRYGTSFRGSYARQDKPVSVIPFVFYHGKKAWDLGTDFAAHFTFSEAERQIFAPYLPDFRFELFDLGDQDVETLTIILYVRMFMQIIRSIDTNRLDDNLRDTL